MRRKIRAALVWVFAVSCVPAISGAAVVIVKGSNQPVMGYLMRQDERSVVLREVLPGGKTRESSFARGNIDELIITVAPERLESLAPTRLNEYLEYAEELAEKQRDPEARETAQRLYGVVAARGEGPLKRSAMLGLIALARSAAEERRLLAAAYLFGDEHDPSLLKRQQAGATATISPSAIADLLMAARLVRQAKGAQARSILEKASLRNEAPRLVGVVSLDELAELAGGSQLTNPQLARVLRAELALEELKLGRSTNGETGAGDGQPWSAAVRPGGLEPMPLLSLEKLTGFDPAECVFRNGKWTRP
jgi:hypothetical protein